MDQTNGKKINDYYDDYSESFDEDNKLTKKIESAMDLITKLCDKTTLSFVSKKAQMYTLFSFSFKLIDDNLTYTTEVFERFKLFVAAYNLFRNEYNIEFEDEELANVNDGIKKYKLASSEGINKIGNRMIRFQILYNFCVHYSPDVKSYLTKLAEIYENKKSNVVSYVPFDSEDENDIIES